jgi:hypothetical protein
MGLNTKAHHIGGLFNFLPTDTPIALLSEGRVVNVPRLITDLRNVRFHADPSNPVHWVEAVCKDAADWIERTSQWVSVSERLPDREQRVLVVLNGEAKSAWYYPPGKFQPEITHWMPLPSPPVSRPPETRQSLRR